jgi:chromosome segregation ATPase
VRSVFASAWRTARQEAGLEVLAVREKAAEEVKEALQQFHGALEAIEKLEKESEYDAVEIEAFKITLAGRNAEITRLEAENAAEKAAAQELRGQIESQKEELARLHKELDQSRGERDSAMKEAAELKGVADTLKTQNEQLMARWNVQDEKRK